MTKKNIYLIAGGAVLAALGIAAALNYPPKFGSDAAQGAIGQRQVYRDNAVTSGDVAVTPGAAPVADQVNGAKNEIGKATSGQSAMQSEGKYSTGMQSEAKYSTGMQSEGRAPSMARENMQSEGRASSTARSNTMQSEGRAPSMARERMNSEGRAPSMARQP